MAETLSYDPNEEERKRNQYAEPVKDKKTEKTPEDKAWVPPEYRTQDDSLLLYNVPGSRIGDTTWVKKLEDKLEPETAPESIIRNYEHGNVLPKPEEPEPAPEPEPEPEPEPTASYEPMVKNTEAPEPEAAEETPSSTEPVPAKETETIVYAGAAQPDARGAGGASGSTLKGELEEEEEEGAAEWQTPADAFQPRGETPVESRTPLVFSSETGGSPVKVDPKTMGWVENPAAAYTGGQGNPLTLGAPMSWDELQAWIAEHPYDQPSTTLQIPEVPTQTPEEIAAWTAAYNANERDADMRKYYGITADEMSQTLDMFKDATAADVYKAIQLGWKPEYGVDPVAYYKTAALPNTDEYRQFLRDSQTPETDPRHFERVVVDPTTGGVIVPVETKQPDGSYSIEYVPADEVPSPKPGSGTPGNGRPGADAGFDALAGDTGTPGSGAGAGAGGEKKPETGSGSGSGDSEDTGKPPKGSVYFTPSYGQENMEKGVKAPYRREGYSEDELIAWGNAAYGKSYGKNQYEGYYLAPNGKYYPVDQAKANYYKQHGSYEGWNEGMREYYDTFGTFYGYRKDWKTAGKAGNNYNYSPRTYYSGGNRGGGSGSSGSGYSYGAGTPANNGLYWNGNTSWSI